MSSRQKVSCRAPYTDGERAWLLEFGMSQSRSARRWIPRQLCARRASSTITLSSWLPVDGLNWTGRLSAGSRSWMPALEERNGHVFQHHSFAPCLD
jgi:hypothetical protein